MKCPLCHYTSVTTVFQSRDRAFPQFEEKFSVVRCTDCTVFFLCPPPDPETLRAHYPSAYNVYQDFPEPQKRGMRNFFLRHTLAYWLGYGKKYFWQSLLYPYFLRISYHPHWHANGRLLEVGCGNGRFLDELRRLGWQVTGTDISSASIGVAKQHQLEVYQGTLQEIAFKKEEFDAIVLHHVFEHLENPIETLLEIKRILKPKGELIITVPNSDSVVRKLFGSDWFGWEVPRHLFHYNRRALADVLHRSGFRITSMQSIAFLDTLPQSLLYKYKSSFFRTALALRLLGRTAAFIGLLGSPIANVLKIGDALTVKAAK